MDLFLFLKPLRKEGSPIAYGEKENMYYENNKYGVPPIECIDTLNMVHATRGAQNREERGKKGVVVWRTTFLLTI